jgi:uncharacterized membrane protein
MINRKKRVSLGLSLGLAAVLLLLFTVLVIGTQTRYLRDDEGIAFAGTSESLTATIGFQARDVHAPLYFVLFYFWQQFVGDGEFTARLFSVLTSLLTLAVTYKIGERWFGCVSFGLTALIALGLSSYFFVYGIEIRPYALVMLIAALSMACFVQWLRERTWRNAVFYGLTFGLMLYTHYLSVFVFVMQAIFFLLQGRRAWTWKLWRQGIGAFILGLLLWLPWFPVFINQVRHVGQLVKPEDTRIPGLGMAATTLPTNATNIGSLILLATNAQPLLYGAILLIGLVLLWRKRWYWLAVGWTIAVPTLMFVGNLLVPIYEPRYATSLVPGLGLLVGISLAALPGRWIVKTVPLVIFMILATSTIHSGSIIRLRLRDYLREMEAAYRPGDAVYLAGMEINPYDHVNTYQYRHYAPSAWRYLQTPLHTSTQMMNADSFAPPRCIWFITPRWSDSRVKADFGAIAAHRPLQRVIGDEQTYLIQQLCGPPQVAPKKFGEALRFLGMDIDSKTRNALTLKLWWDVEKAPNLDYSFGVYLVNQFGRTVAQQDGPIVSFWGGATIHTSQLMSGVLYVDHRTLTLPDNLPPGRYVLLLAVYQPWDQARLPVAGGIENALIIETITLP